MGIFRAFPLLFLALYAVNAGDYNDYSADAEVVVPYKTKTVTYEHCSNHANIVFLIDGSGSISAGDWSRMRSFLVRLLNKLVGTDVHIGIVVYSSCAKTVMSLGAVSNVDDIKETVYGMSSLGGKTNTYKGLMTVHNMLKASDHQGGSNVIVISDGMSNVNCDKTVMYANKMKNDGITIISVAVGRASEPTSGGFREMEGMSSDGNVISVTSYAALGDETIVTICSAFEITEGHICAKGSTDATLPCGIFRCTKSGNNYYWRHLYSGCIYNGECLSWGASISKDDDCNSYVCARDGCASNAEFCAKFQIAVDTVGCSYGDECFEEGQERDSDEACTREVCTRFNGPQGPYGDFEVSSRKCPRDGSCYNIGTSYNEGCDVYTCGSAGYYYPSKQACSFNGQCVDENDTANDKCDIWKCVFDDKTECYQMRLHKLRCCWKDGCKDVGDSWDDLDKCIHYRCIEKDGDAFVVDSVTGCKSSSNSACTPVAGSVRTVENTCVQYRCNADGNFELVAAGCKDSYGKCRQNGETWDSSNGCWVNKCVVDTSNPMSVLTNIIRIHHCLIHGKCVKRGDTLRIGCTVFKCSADGRTVVLKRDCEYKGKCITPGSKPFVDRSVCKLVACVVGAGGFPSIVTTDYGCLYRGVCYDPDATRKDSYGCLTYKCHAPDHRFYPSNCKVGGGKCIEVGETYLDSEDCVMEKCVLNSFPPGAELEEMWTGCLHDGKCYEQNDKRTDKCVDYRCVGNHEWVVCKAACYLDDGTCKNIGDTWFDEAACRKYECRAGEGPNSASVVVVVLGCSTSSGCVVSGDSVSKNRCLSYKCVNGTLTPVNVGCTLPNGRCLDVGKSVRDFRRCVQYTCVLVSRTSSSISVELKEYQGCTDDRCYFAGDRRDTHCRIMVCKPGKGMVLQKIAGCIDENGRCKKVGSVWVNEDTCMKRVCLPSGQIKDVAIGCIDSNNDNKCVRFNGRMATACGERCLEYYCKRRSGNPTRVVKYTGCWYNGKCIDINASVKDSESCLLYTCVMKNGVPSLEDRPYGCISEIDGRCYEYGHIETEPNFSCVQYVCRRSSNSFAVKQAKCDFDGECKNVGSSWYDDDCTKYTCMKESTSTYRVIMISEEEEGCMTDDGDCVAVGTVIKPGNCTSYICIGGDWKIKTLECQTPSGACKDVGETWTANGGCTEYECKQLSETTVEIIETEIGCRDNGQCYEEDESYKKKCTKFECDSGVMRVVEKGCWYNGRCYDINESWVDGSCVTRTCLLVTETTTSVTTDIRSVQGCRYKGQCYSSGDTRKEGCVLKVCLDSGVWGIKVFKCKALDGTCFGAGETWTSSDCTIYGCNADSQSTYPVEYQCLINGKCVKIGTSWQNREQCKNYQCIYNAATQEAIIGVESIGCLNGGQCVCDGGVTAGKAACSKLQCIEGVLTVLSAGCEYNGKCMDVGHAWMDGCAWYKCVYRQRSLTTVTTGIEVVHGCQDCNGKCHRVGAQFTHGCITQQCMPGGRFETIAIQCLDESTGNCVAIGKVVVVGGTKKNCTSHGSFKVIPKPTFCTDNNGGKIAINGEYFDDASCTRYRCEITGYSTKWTAFEYGCNDDGKCRNVGESWFDNLGCNAYRCVASGDGYPTICVQQACKSSDGVCYKVGGLTWTEDCNEYQCVQVGEYGAKSEIVSAGCKSLVNEMCYAEGDSWTDKYKGKCFSFICKKSGKVYKAKIVRQLCMDHAGTCQAVGNTYYDCDVKGSMHPGCSCNAKRRKAYSSYDKDYKPLAYDDTYGTEGYQTDYDGDSNYDSYGGDDNYAYGGPSGYGDAYGEGPASYGEGPASYGEGPASYGEGPASYGEGPASYGEGPASYGEGPASYGEGPASYGEGPASYGEGPASYGSDNSYGGSAYEGQSGYGDAYGEGPASYGEGPASYGEGPASYGEGPASYGEGPASYGSDNSYGGSAYEGQSGYGDAYGEGPASYGEGPASYGEGPASYGEGPASYGEGPASYGSDNSYGGSAYEGQSGYGNAYGEGPASYGEGPASYGEGPASYGEGPASYGEGPASYGEGPASYGEAPASYGGDNSYGGGESYGEAPASYGGDNSYGGGPSYGEAPASYGGDNSYGGGASYGEAPASYGGDNSYGGGASYGEAPASYGGDNSYSGGASYGEAPASYGGDNSYGGGASYGEAPASYGGDNSYGGGASYGEAPASYGGDNSYSGGASYGEGPASYGNDNSYSGGPASYSNDNSYSGGDNGNYNDVSGGY